MRALILVFLSILILANVHGEEEKKGFVPQLSECFTIDWAKGFIPCLTKPLRENNKNFLKVIPIILDSLLPDWRDKIPPPFNESLPWSHVEHPVYPAAGRHLLSMNLNAASRPHSLNKGKLIFLDHNGNHEKSNAKHEKDESEQIRYIPHSATPDMSNLHATDEFQDSMAEALHAHIPRTFEEKGRLAILKEMINQIDFNEVHSEFLKQAFEQLLMLRTTASFLSLHPEAANMKEGASTYGISNFFTTIGGFLEDALCNEDALAGCTDPDCPNAEDYVPECKYIASILKCLGNREDSEFEDSLTWTQCVLQCSDFPLMSQCVMEQFSTNLQCELPWPIKDLSWVAPVAIKAVATFMKKEDCGFDVVSPVASETGFTMAEGDAAVPVTFRLFMPPQVYCLGDIHKINTPLGMIKWIADILRRKVGQCPVQVHVATQTFIDDLYSNVPDISIVGIPGGPFRCRAGVVKRQAVLGAGKELLPHLHAGAGLINITDKNWMNHFTLALAPTIDSRFTEDNVKNSLVLRLKATCLPRMKDITQRFDFTITEGDKANNDGKTTCHATGDGHIVTVDHFYFKNFYQGHFYLYKHKELPYEVQIVYQACLPSSQGACACGVAARFGDDVFVIDRCRVKGAAQPAEKVMLYQNGELTGNVRVFRSEGGLRYRIIFPHGTTVTVLLDPRSLVAYVRPSAADKTKSEGLCGVFRGDGQLTLANGEVDSTPAGGVAHNFTTSWRVPEGQQIMWGAVANQDKDAVDSNSYCTCVHTIFKGSNCNCGTAYMVEACDMEVDGEITQNLTQISKPSLRQYQTLNPSEKVIPVLDMDESHVPSDPVWSPNSMNETEAREVCLNGAIQKDLVVAMCDTADYFRVMKVFGGVKKYFAEDYVTLSDVCVANIQANETNAQNIFSSTESVRQLCTDRLYQIQQFKVGSPVTQEVVDNLYAVACPRGCSNNGVCSNRICTCNAGYAGVDCSQALMAKPSVDMPPTVLCDIRNEECQWVQIYGENFRPNSKLHATASRAEGPEIKENHFLISDDGYRSLSGHVQSPVQATVKLPEEWHHQISVVVENENGEKSDVNRFRYLAYDAQCYWCDPTKNTCQEKEHLDHCIIGGACMPLGELRADDSCYTCNATHLRYDWSIVASEECHEHHDGLVDQEEKDKRENVIRWVVACSLSAGVAVAAFVLFLFIGRQKSHGGAASAAPPLSSKSNMSQRASSMSNNYTDYASATAYVQPNQNGGIKNPGYHTTNSVISDDDYEAVL